MVFLLHVTRINEKRTESGGKCNSHISGSPDLAANKAVYFHRPSYPQSSHKSPLNIQTADPLALGFYSWSWTRRQFVPPVVADLFFDVRSQRVPVNFTEPNVALRLELSIRGHSTGFGPTTLIMRIISIRGHKQCEGIQSLFINGNPVLLCVTGIATVLHSVFEILALERDLQFWRKKTSVVGVSMRSLAVQLLGQILVTGHTFSLL
jgi:hypothetical protein